MDKPFIIAEMGANHGGQLRTALQLVRAAADSGADAIKVQTFTPEQMADADTVIEAGPWAGRKALELYQQAHTPREWHADIFELARGRHLVPMASVFHPDDVDFLETLDCPIYKIASFELTDIPLIERVSRTGKPMIMSTGMATEEEIERALEAAFSGHVRMLKAAVDNGVTLLKCTSAYPALPHDANLATMTAMRARWNVDVGISDHTEGHAVAVAATVMGADVIEKHLKLSAYERTLDDAFSMTPHEFKAMVSTCRTAAAAIGEVRYGPLPAEASSLQLRRAPGAKRGAIVSYVA